MPASTPLYSPAGLPTLSGAADLLKEDDLSDLAHLAEQLLGLTAVPGLTGTQARTAQLAVGMQVSFMVEQGVASRLYKTLSEGERRYEFAPSATSGVDPVAAALVAPLLGAALPVEPAPASYLVVKTF